MNELLINGKDALTTWGVRMGEGFLNALNDFPSMKPYLESESRLNDGKEILIENPKVASRKLNLTFTIEGSSLLDFQSKKAAFIAELLKGNIVIKVPPMGETVYKLCYLGSQTRYKANNEKTFASVSLRFVEPNPADRIEASNI